jgi:hypothetical protein
MDLDKSLETVAVGAPKKLPASKEGNVLLASQHVFDNPVISYEDPCLLICSPEELKCGGRSVRPLDFLYGNIY